MSFLYPLFLLGALAVAIPIVLHLLRRDVAPEVPFSAVRLLHRMPLEQTRRRRLRDWLLLAARVGALLLLAIAFARPYLTGAADSTELHIVAVDRSYSLGSPGQFARARERAADAIAAAGRGARIALVAFDERAEVLARPGSAADARAALAGLRPGYGATRYAPLLSRAVELADSGRAVLTVVTDMQRTGWEGEPPQSIPGTIEVRVKEVGAPASNAAIVGLAKKEDGGIRVTVRSSGEAPAAADVRLRLDGEVVATVPVTVPARTTVDVPISAALPARGAVAVEIDDAEGYAADNVRYLVLDDRVRPRVLVVSGDPAQSGYYLTRALLASDGDGAPAVEAMAAAAFGRMSAEQLERYSAIVLLSTRNLERRARDMLAAFVRAGGGLFVAASGDVDPSALAAAFGAPDFAADDRATAPGVLAATDLRHPIFSPFGPLAANLGQVQFTRAWRVREDGWTVAARFTDGSPALLERRPGEGTVLVFASDLDRRWNDFPLHPAFAPFAIEAVRHIAGSPDSRNHYLVGAAPAGAGSEPGIYTLERSARRIAVNVDPREGAPSRLSSDEFLGMIERHGGQPETAGPFRAADAEASQNLWRYGLMLMLLVLVAESAVGRSWTHG